MYIYKQLVISALATRFYHIYIYIFTHPPTKLFFNETSAGQWHRLSPYISAVFEGALRNDKEVSAVQLSGRLGLYLVANLEVGMDRKGEQGSHQNVNIVVIYIYIYIYICTYKNILVGMSTTQVVDLGPM